jgi:uncharacterized ubiquitin-like protein YukD
MSEGQVQITVKNWDDTRRAQVTLPTTMRVAELVSTCREQWNLPSGETFLLRNTKTNQQLQDAQTLSDAGVTDGTEIEVYPLIGGGGIGG